MTALFTIFSNTKTLPRPLGSIFAHRLYDMNGSSPQLKTYSIKSPSLSVYVPDGIASRRNARHFRFSRSLPHYPTGTHYASLVSVSTDAAVAHSVTPITSAPKCRSLQDIIDDFDDQVMWDKFEFDGDGSWLLHALLNGTLVFVYMRFVTTKACSCGFVLYCSHSDNRAVGSFAEESDMQTIIAENGLEALMHYRYRCFWLCWTLRCCLSTPFPRFRLICDNMGVVNHN